MQMNDNLKYLRNKNKQEGDAQEAEANVQKMEADNAKESEIAETQKPVDEIPPQLKSK